MSVCNCLESTEPIAASWVMCANGWLTSTTGTALARARPCTISLQSTWPRAYGAEAVRVLARTGVLLLLGLNRMGWRYRVQDDIRRLPGIAPLRVKSRLEELGMTMQGFAGAGLGGQTRPAFLGGGLAGMATPLADVLLLQARHKDSPEVTPLRFRKSRSTVVQSAPLRG